MSSRSLSSHPLLQKHFPYKSKYVEIAGHQMHYVDEGDGPVLLCIHGNPTWGFYYRNVIKELRSHYRVIAPDFLGMGLSDHPTNSHFRAAHRIEHLKEFVDALGLTKFSLMMHDWGGSIGTGFAVDRPESIEKFIYLNTTLTETESLPFLIKAAATPGIGKYLTKISTRFLRFTTSPTFGVARKLSKDIIRAYMVPYRTMKRRTAIWDFVADIPFDSSHPTYAEMLRLAEGLPDLAEKPVQIIWGLKDPCFHREMLSKVAEHFPQASVLEIPSASHLVLEDAPEESLGAIKSFLGGQGVDHRVGVTGPPAEENKECNGNAFYQRFLETAEANPNKLAVVVPSFLGDTPKYTQITYRDFSALVNKYQRGLLDLGLRRGDKVLMLVSPGVDFLALSFAVMGRAALPIYLDPGMGKEKLFRCIKEIKPDVFIGSPKAQLLRMLKKSLFASLKFHVNVADWLFVGGPNLSFLKKFAAKPVAAERTTGSAFVAFTSGATGRPKGVVFTDAMVKGQLDIFQNEFGLEPGCKDLPLLPIFSLYNVALGVCSVFPPIDPSRPLALDPKKVVQIIRDQSVDFSFGSPTLWKKIAEYCIRSRVKLASLKKVLIAGAAVPEKTLETVQSVIPNGEAFTPYGSTEALPTTKVSANEILARTFENASSGEAGAYVGRAVAAVEVKIIQPVDGAIESEAAITPCAPYEIGEVIVRGPNVSPEYFEREDATRVGKFSATQGGVWHRMGDLGYLDGQAALYFCGRKVHAVKTTEKIFYSVPCERIFNEHEKVSRSALVGLHADAEGYSSEAAIVIEPKPEHWPETEESRLQFAEEIRERAKASAVTSSIERVFFHESFPVDGRHNAKIFRDELSRWASKPQQFRKAA